MKINNGMIYYINSYKTMKLLESYKQTHDIEVPKSDTIASIDKAKRQALQDKLHNIQWN